MGISAILGGILVPALIGGAVGYGGYSQVDTANQAKDLKKKQEAEQQRMLQDAQKKEFEKSEIQKATIARDAARQRQRGGIDTNKREGTVIGGPAPGSVSNPVSTLIGGVSGYSDSGKRELGK